MQKFKVLCLHGYGTNAHFLEKQFEPLNKALSQYCQFIFVDAPFEAPENFVVDEKVLQLIKGPTLSWFPHASSKYDTERFYLQLDHLKTAFQKASDHYDGIIGFSQGAVLTHFLLRNHQQGKLKWKIFDKLKFCLIASGNVLKWQGLSNSQPLTIPSLHLLSPEDFLFSRSILTTTQFLNPVILRHHFGHRIPKLGKSDKSQLRGFIKTQIQNSMETSKL